MESGMDIVAKLMAISAMTAQREKNVTDLNVTLLDEAEKEILVEEMFQIAEQKVDETFSQMGEMILDSEGVLLLGLDDDSPLGLNCQACGFSDCLEMSKVVKEDIFQGPNCIFRAIDLGMAVGSALRTARIHNVKVEVMIKGGLAAKRVGLSTSRVVLALPVYLE